MKMSQLFFVLLVSLMLITSLDSCKKVNEYCPVISVIEPLTDYPQINGGNEIEFQKGVPFRLKFNTEDIDGLKEVSVSASVYERKTSYSNVVNKTPYTKLVDSGLSEKYTFDELIIIDDIGSYNFVPFMLSITSVDTKGNRCTQYIQIFITKL